ncbi:hypothetical protein CF326_g6554 [Tilletia indica]|nr:hypothetical protein CF326_g6554 [Tilletia indica]
MFPSPSASPALSPAAFLGLNSASASGSSHHHLHQSSPQTSNAASGPHHLQQSHPQHHHHHPFSHHPPPPQQQQQHPSHPLASHHQRNQPGASSSSINAWPPLSLVTNGSSSSASTPNASSLLSTTSSSAPTGSSATTTNNNNNNGSGSRFGAAAVGGPFGSASSPFAPGPFGPLAPPPPPHHQQPHQQQQQQQHHHPGHSHAGGGGVVGGPPHHPSPLSHNHGHPHPGHGHGHGHGSFGNLGLGALGLGGGGAGSGGNGSGGAGNQGGAGNNSQGGGPSLGGGSGGGGGGGLGSAASSAFNPSGSSANLLGGLNGPPPGMGGPSSGPTSSSSNNNMSHLQVSSHWQSQLLKAEISRQSAAPHHHARAAALAARSATSSAIAIQDPSAKAAAAAAAAAATGASGSAPPANGLFVSKREAPTGGGGVPANSDSAAASPRVTSATAAAANGSASKDGADAGPVQTWTTIDMGGLSLKNLSTDLFKYSFLTSLFVNHNALTALSPAIVQLRSLTVLDASGNKLTSIPAELGMLTCLRELFLFDNALTTLPPELGTLHQLEMLGIEGNPLSDKLRSLIQREGTLALIAYLRDSCPVPLPPPEREWITIETDIVASGGSQSDLGARGGYTGPGGSSFFMTEAEKRKVKASNKKVKKGKKEDGEARVGGADGDRDDKAAEGAEKDGEDDDAEEDEDEDEAPEPSPESFNLLTYNILCDRYATSQMYGYTPSWALSWDYRKELILQEVMSYSADVCCLQEVDIEQYEDYFLHHLSQQDYEGVFWPKSRARTMRDEERRHVDGCAIFYKANKWTLIEKRLIEFNQLALQRPDFKKTQDLFNRVMTKDQIAVIALLENRATGARLLVATVHVYWDPEFRDVKLVQVGMLMDELEKIANQFAKLPPKLSSMLAEPYRKKGPPAYKDGTCIPTVICGDFNSVPDTGVYSFLRQGQIGGDHEDFMSHVYGRYTSLGLEHKLNLRSAYEGIGELTYTNYTPDYKGVIDYVWYNTNALAVSGLLGDVDPAYRDKVVGFPNAHFPSDHVCLLAEFTVRPSPASTAVTTAPTPLMTASFGNHNSKRITAAAGRAGSGSGSGSGGGGGGGDEDRNDKSTTAEEGASASTALTSSKGNNANSSTTSGSGGSSFGFGGLGSKLAAATNRRTFNPDFSTFGRTGSR